MIFTMVYAPVFGLLNWPLSSAAYLPNQSPSGNVEISKVLLSILEVGVASSQSGGVALFVARFTMTMPATMVMASSTAT